MPAASNIVLADATPANRTFEPVGPYNGGYLYEYRSTGTSAGFQTLWLAIDKAHSGRSTNRVKYKLSVPKEVTVDGIVSVQHTPIFEGYTVLPDAMSDSERDHMDALITNLFANSVVKGLVNNLANVY